MSTEPGADGSPEAPEGSAAMSEKARWRALHQELTLPAALDGNPAQELERGWGGQGQAPWGGSMTSRPSGSGERSRTRGAMCRATLLESRNR